MCVNYILQIKYLTISGLKEPPDGHSYIWEEGCSGVWRAVRLAPWSAALKTHSPGPSWRNAGTTGTVYFKFQPVFTPM